MTHEPKLILYKVLVTFEFEMSSTKDEIRGRVTLLQGIADRRKFRMYVSTRDLFSLQLWVPEKRSSEAAEHSDEVLWTDRPLPKLSDDDFEADSVEDAEKIVITRIQEFKEHLTA